MDGKHLATVERVRDGRTAVIRLPGEGAEGDEAESNAAESDETEGGETGSDETEGDETEGGEAKRSAGERVEVALELLPPGTHEPGSSLTVWLAGGEFVHAEPHDEDDGGGLLSRLFGR